MLFTFDRLQTELQVGSLRLRTSSSDSQQARSKRVWCSLRSRWPGRSYGKVVGGSERLRGVRRSCDELPFGGDFGQFACSRACGGGLFELRRRILAEAGGMQGMPGGT